MALASVVILKSPEFSASASSLAATFPLVYRVKRYMYLFCK